MTKIRSSGPGRFGGSRFSPQAPKRPGVLVKSNSRGPRPIRPSRQSTGQSDRYIVGLSRLLEVERNPTGSRGRSTGPDAAHRPPAMSGLPDVLKIPDGPEKLSIPAGDLPVSALIKLKLPPQRASSIYTHPTDYLSELAPTITTFNAAEIVVPPSHVVKALGRAILLDPELQSIELVHSLSQQISRSR
ncbi:hypothetical protein DFH09DRAFT_1106599 [Mycena vulgaris]|nr:hypothetical protein DFH09DRAFT_1106599 [Mycena vulgaris]